jgi:hypothetical protein
MTTANCPVHGAQQATLVCQHIAVGLVRRERVGFWWSSSPGSSRPDAWCTACNDRLNATGDWVGEALEQANPQTLCGACYDMAKVFHMGGDPWV